MVEEAQAIRKPGAKPRPYRRLGRYDASLVSMRAAGAQPGGPLSHTRYVLSGPLYLSVLYPRASYQCVLLLEGWERKRSGVHQKIGLAAQAEIRRHARAQGRDPDAIGWGVQTGPALGTAPPRGAARGPGPCRSASDSPRWTVSRARAGLRRRLHRDAGALRHARHHRVQPERGVPRVRDGRAVCADRRGDPPALCALSGGPARDPGHTHRSHLGPMAAARAQRAQGDRILSCSGYYR
jgi:hypothetical protein